MLLLNWIRRAVAEAFEQGARDGLANAGFRPVEQNGEAAMVLWLQGGELKQLPASEAEPKAKKGGR